MPPELLEPRHLLSTVTVTAFDNAAAEAGLNTGTFRIARNDSPATALTVNFGMSGTALSGSDYTALSGSATILSGQTYVDVTLTPIDNTVAEPSETAIMTILANASYTVGSPASATVNIADNDTVPEITVSVSDSSAAEATPVTNTGLFTVKRSLATASPLTVNYSMSGTASNGADYTTLSGTVTIAANASTATVTITPIDDTTYDPSETAILTVTSGSGYTIGSPANGTVTITDNDPAPPTVTITATTATASEPATNGVFTVARTGATTSALTVAYVIGGTATGGTDYTTLTGSVTIPAGQANTTINVAPIDDTTCEGNETVQLTLSSGSGYTVGSPASATVTINDNDLPAITITSTDSVGSETSPNTANFTFTRTGPTTQALTVTYTVSGTATAPSDYGTLSGSITIAAGSATAAITITPVNDTAIEGTETVVLTLGTGTTFVAGNPSSCTITIEDNDAPLVSVTATDAAASEIGADPGTFRFARTGSTAQALSFTYAVSGTAANNTDFSLLNGTFIIPAGAANATLNVTPLTDTLIEGNETVVVTIQVGGGYTVGSPSSATVTIADDGRPTVNISATDASAAEAGTDPGTYTVTRNGPTTAALTVLYTKSGTAATADYATLTGSVVIPIGQSSATIQLTPVDDTEPEDPETVRLTLASSPDYFIGTSTFGEVTIADNDPPVVTITASDPIAREAGLETGTYLVQRTGPTTNSLVVLYSVSGTASSSDFNSLAGSVTIPIGAASATITLTPQNDSLLETHETVVVTLTAQSAYQIGLAAAATVVIVDDENHAPVAADDAFDVNYETTAFVDSLGVLDNDSDADDDPLEAILVNSPAHGTLQLLADGAFFYTPNAGYTGQDSFTYKPNDGGYDGNTATVTLTVAAPPAPEIHLTVQDNALTDGGTLNFGTNTLGQPKTVTVKIRNMGQATLSLDGTSLVAPGGYTVTSFSETSLASGQSTQFTVQLNATATGIFTGALHLTNGDADENPFDITLTGIVELAPEIDVQVNGSPLTSGTGVVQFPDAYQGFPVDESLSITNNGNANLTINQSGITLPSGFSLVLAPDPVVAPGLTTTMIVRINASALGEYSGQVSVPNNDRDEGPFVFTVKGKVVTPAAQLQVSTNGSEITNTEVEVDFGSTEYLVAETRTFTVSNSGVATIDLTGKILLPGGFRLVSVGDSSISPGESTQVVVALRGDSPGDHAGSISFAVEARGLSSFKVKGHVLAAKLHVTQSGQTIKNLVNDVPFGHVVSGSSVVKTFNLSNLGDGTLQLQPTINLPAGFLLEQPLGSLTLAPGASTTFSVRLNTTAAGRFSGPLSLDSNDPRTPHFTCMLSGDVDQPELQLSLSDGTPLNIAGVVDFGNTPLGQQVTKTIRLKNIGTQGVSVGQTPNLPQGYDIATQLSDTNLAPQEEATIVIRLDAATSGLFAGQIVFSTSDLRNSRIGVSLQGGVAIPEAAVSDAGNPLDADHGLDLGTTFLGAPRSRTLSVTNTGTSNLSLQETIAVPAGFSVTSGLSSLLLAPGATATFTVQANASATGEAEGDLVLQTNDPKNPEIHIPVRATCFSVSAPRMWNDTGVSATDSITSDPALAVTVTGTWNQEVVFLDWDLLADGNIEESSIAQPDGTFRYVPPGLENGVHTVAVRTRIVGEGGSEQTSSWTPITFTLADGANATPTLVDIALWNDNGTSSTDKQSSDPRISGRLVNDGALGQMLVEMDEDADGVADAEVQTANDGTFRIRPLVDAPGAVSVRLRAIERAYRDELLTGEWISFDFTLTEAVPPNVSVVQLLHDTGESATDKITWDSTLTGTVGTDGLPRLLRVELDSDMDGTADVSADVDEDLHFEIKPGRLESGQRTVQVRAVSDDLNLTGSWQTFSFTLEDLPGPVISRLVLSRDTGTSNTDNTTSDSSIEGDVTYEGSLEHLTVEIDLNDDLVSDVTTLTDVAGKFYLVPPAMNLGNHKINVRARGYDAAAGQSTTGMWRALDFTLQSENALTISDFALLHDTGSSSTDKITIDPTVTGTITGEGATSFQTVEFDTTGDGIADGTALSGLDGTFRYVPAQVQAGSVTIRARVSKWDELRSANVYGEWASLTITVEQAPNATGPEPLDTTAIDTAAQSAETIVRSGSIASVQAGVAAHNAAAGGGSAPAGRLGLPFGNFEPLYLMNSPLAPESNAYAFQNGPPRAGIPFSSPWQWYAVVAPTAGSGTLNAPINLSGSTTNGTYTLTGTVVSDWTTTVTGNSTSGSFVVDQSITVTFTWHETGTISAAENGRTGIRSYTNDITGTYTISVLASGSYNVVVGDSSMSGTYSIDEGLSYTADYSDDYAFTYSLGYTSGSGTQSSDLSFDNSWTHTEPFGSFTISQGAGPQVISAFDESSSAQITIANSDSMNYVVAAPGAASTGFSTRSDVRTKSRQLTQLGSYTQSSVVVTDFALNEISSTDVQSSNVGTYNKSHLLGTASGAFAESYLLHKDSTNSETGDYTIDSTGWVVTVDTLSRTRNGISSHQSTQNGSYTVNMLGTTEAVDATSVDNGQSAYGYTEIGSYVASPGSFDLTIAAFSLNSSLSGTQTLSSSGTFNLSVPNGLRSGAHAMSLSSTYGASLIDAGSRNAHNADISIQGTHTLSHSVSASSSQSSSVTWATGGLTAVNAFIQQGTHSSSFGTNGSYLSDPNLYTINAQFRSGQQGSSTFSGTTTLDDVSVAPPSGTSSSFHSVESFSGTLQSDFSASGSHTLARTNTSTVENKIGSWTYLNTSNNSVDGNLNGSTSNTFLTNKSTSSISRIWNSVSDLSEYRSAAFSGDSAAGSLVRNDQQTASTTEEFQYSTSTKATTGVLFSDYHGTRNLNQQSSTSYSDSGTFYQSPNSFSSLADYSRSTSTSMGLNGTDVGTADTTAFPDGGKTLRRDNSNAGYSSSLQDITTEDGTVNQLGHLTTTSASFTLLRQKIDNGASLVDGIYRGASSGFLSYYSSQSSSLTYSESGQIFSSPSVNFKIADFSTNLKSTVSHSSEHSRDYDFELGAHSVGGISTLEWMLQDYSYNESGNYQISAGHITRTASYSSSEAMDMVNRSNNAGNATIDFSSSSPSTGLNAGAPGYSLTERRQYVDSSQQSATSTKTETGLYINTQGSVSKIASFDLFRKGNGQESSSGSYTHSMSGDQQAGYVKDISQEQYSSSMDWASAYSESGSFTHGLDQKPVRSTQLSYSAQQFGNTSTSSSNVFHLGVSTTHTGPWIYDSVGLVNLLDRRIDQNGTRDSINDFQSSLLENATVTESWSGATNPVLVHLRTGTIKQFRENKGINNSSSDYSFDDPIHSESGGGADSSTTTLSSSYSESANYVNLTKTATFNSWTNSNVFGSSSNTYVRGMAVGVPTTYTFLHTAQETSHGDGRFADNEAGTYESVSGTVTAKSAAFTSYDSQSSTFTKSYTDHSEFSDATAAHAGWDRVWEEIKAVTPHDMPGTTLLGKDGWIPADFNRVVLADGTTLHGHGAYTHDVGGMQTGTRNAETSQRGTVNFANSAPLTTSASYTTNESLSSTFSGSSSDNVTYSLLTSTPQYTVAGVGTKTSTATFQNGLSTSYSATGTLYKNPLQSPHVTEIASFFSSKSSSSSDFNSVSGRADYNQIGSHSTEDKSATYRGSRSSNGTKASAISGTFRMDGNADMPKQNNGGFEMPTGYAIYDARGTQSGSDYYVGTESISGSDAFSGRISAGDRSVTQSASLTNSANWTNTPSWNLNFYEQRYDFSADVEKSSTVIMSADHRSDRSGFSGFIPYTIHYTASLNDDLTILEVFTFDVNASPQKSGTRTIWRVGYSSEVVYSSNVLFIPSVNLKSWNLGPIDQDINIPFVVPTTDEEEALANFRYVVHVVQVIVDALLDTPAELWNMAKQAFTDFKRGDYLEAFVGASNVFLGVMDYVGMAGVAIKGVGKLINAVDNIADAAKASSKVAKGLDASGDTAKGVKGLDNIHDASRAKSVDNAFAKSGDPDVIPHGKSVDEAGTAQQSLRKSDNCFVGETFVLASGGQSLAGLPVIAVAGEPEPVAADASQAWDREKILRGLVVVAFAYGAMHAVNRRRKRPFSAAGESNATAREKYFSALGRGTLRIDDPRLDAACLDDIAEPPGMLPECAVHDRLLAQLLEEDLFSEEDLVACQSTVRTQRAAATLVAKPARPRRDRFLRHSLPVESSRPRNQPRAKKISRDYSRLPGRLIFAAGLLFAFAMFWQALPRDRHESRRDDSLAAASLTSTVDKQTSSAAPLAVGIQAAAFGPALPEAPLADQKQPVDSAGQTLPLHFGGNSVGREPRPPTTRHGRFLRITSVRLGQRLVGRNPIREQAELIEPVRETWRHISLSMGKSDGGRLWIELLRPIAWIDAVQAEVGGEIYLDLTELGAVGWATVNAILPCPEIEPGEGTVVTGTFKHQANEHTRVLRLALEGQAEQTGVTDNHPYWSVDRQEFVPAGELHVGETVDTIFGQRRVESLTPIAADDPSFDGYLYNLETTEHVYRVGTLATLVHNKGAGERVDPSSVGAGSQVNPRLVKRLEAFRAYKANGGTMDMARWVSHTKANPNWGTGSKGGYADWIRSVESLHGNSKLSSRPAYLYRLEDAEGNLLKWGITQDLDTRYPGSFLLDKRLIEIGKGSRAEILRRERELVETLPGPLNFEPWAGSKEL